MYRSLLGAVALLLGSSAWAQQAPTQSDFHEMAKDVVTVAGYKWLAPAEATGLTGFSLGAYGVYLPITDKEAYRNLSGRDLSEIGMVGLVAQKGLPFGFDLGIIYGYLPEENVKTFGVGLQYAVLEGSVATPAVALRAGYHELIGVNSPEVYGYSFDVAVSKGFANLTPYGSIGYLRGRLNSYDDIPGIVKEDLDLMRITLGLRASFGLFDITPEYEHAGSHSFNMRLGFSF